MTGKFTFLQELRNDFRLLRGIKQKRSAAKSVFGLCKQVIQRDNSIRTGEVGCVMVRLGDTDIWGCIRCDIGDDIVIDLSVVSVQS